MNKNYLLLLSVCFLIFIAIFIRVIPYISHDFKVEIGFDTGIYEYLLNKFDISSSRSDVYSNLNYYEEGFKIWMEPGFFILNSIVMSLSHVSTEFIFRYYLPIITLLLFSLLILLYGKDISRKEIIIISIFFLSTSTIFLDASNESFYKQIFSSFILFLSLFYIDKFVHMKINIKHVVTLSLLFSGIILYHRAISFILFGITVFFIFIILSKKQDVNIIKKILIICFFSIIITSIYWIEILPNQLKILSDSISFSTNTLSSVLSSNYDKNEMRFIGGGKFEPVENYQNQIIGYITEFPYIFILSIAGILFLVKSHKYEILIISYSLLFLYIFFGMNFSNRLIFEFSILSIILSLFGLLFLYNIFKNKKIFFSIVTIIIILMFINSINFQESRQPYITKNLDGISYIEKNIHRNSSIIFTSDYLAASLISRNFRISIYDDFIGEIGQDAIIKTENFIVNSPKNKTFLIEFIKSKNLTDVDIYVIWGSWEEKHPYWRTGNTVPYNSYSNSQYFIEVYNGNYEIKKIYLLNKSRLM